MACGGPGIWVALVMCTALTWKLQGYEFHVGGTQGWVVNPFEDYNHWAARMRFQVNDTLLFKYKKGADSVLVVNLRDYDTCNTQNPMLRMDGGDSIFKFDRSGPFFFISGIKDHCDSGQKLIVVVLALSHTPTGPPAPGYVFRVGGAQGWVVSPSVNYNDWAGRMRFQVNDTLYFKYTKGTDSVLVVNQGDYDTCNTQNPILKMDGGDSVFKLDRSGPFFFISGTKEHCDKGQKLIVVVLSSSHTPTGPPAPAAPSPKSSPPSSSPMPPPASQPPEIAPASPSPAPALSPISTPPNSSPTPASASPGPSPKSSPPSSSPMLPPTSQPPAIAPVSPSPAPALSPKPAAPNSSPTPSPASQTPASAPAPLSPSPASPPTLVSPTPSLTPAPENSSPPSSTPTPPSTLTSPPPGAQSTGGTPPSNSSTSTTSSAAVVSPSVVLISAVTLGLALIAAP